MFLVFRPPNGTVRQHEQHGGPCFIAAVFRAVLRMPAVFCRPTQHCYSYTLTVPLTLILGYPTNNMAAAGRNFSVIHEKILHCRFVCMCPTMDLVASLHADGQLSVHRCALCNPFSRVTIMVHAPGFSSPLRPNTAVGPTRYVLTDLFRTLFAVL